MMMWSSIDLNTTDLFNRVNDSTTSSAQVSQGEIIIALIFNVALMATVLAGNGLILSAFAINVRLRTLHSVLIIGLCSADVLVGAISIPCWIYVTYCQQNNQPFDFYGYQFYITADIFIGASSIIHLTGISIERFHAVMKPFAHRMLSKSIFYVASGGAWLFAAIIALLQPLQYQQHWENVYTLLNATCFFFLPTTIITVAYICMFRRYRSGPGPSLTRHRASRAVLAREVRLSLTLALITVLFVLAWLPLFSLTMLATFSSSLLPDPLTCQRLLGFVKWMHYSSSAINPFLYSYRNHDMLNTIKLIIYKHVLRQNAVCLEELVRSRSRTNSTTFWSQRSSASHKRTTGPRPPSVSSQFSVCSYRSRNRSEEEDNNNAGSVPVEPSDQTTLCAHAQQ